jgi:hypothetical protein
MEIAILAWYYGKLVTWTSVPVLRYRVTITL